MAYVALSRVRSLSGLYLSAFDPKSVMVSRKSLKEVNRLRETYRKTLYELLLEPRTSSKCKLTGSIEQNLPKLKRQKGAVTYPSRTLPTKRKKSSELEDDKPAQKTRRNYEPKRLQVWQRNACAIMGLEFRGKCRMRPGGPDVPLTPPDMRTIKRIRGGW